MKKQEYLLILGVLLFAFLLWGGLKLFRKGASPTVRITVDGEEYGVYSLDKDQVISIGDTNVCEIKDGSVRMISATCPDQLCILQGAIDERGGIIVCLPNRIVIEGGSTVSSHENPQGIDTVS